ncbi:acyltransferase family protein [Arsenicicoccus sp. UBA7492]|uniref:acyltransferase family protein n=1 Tax=Arsenicicoccus sp. UBA7492 TaxID=1946057 RepID=UPI00257BD9E3|nr:acyltransferase family protein [Arsenicicoccus sp. UBA7492]
MTTAAATDHAERPQPTRGHPTHNWHSPALDGVRAVAVLMVVLFHARVPGLDWGFLGVDLFFVLSGFLITDGLLRAHLGGTGASLVTFWARRIRRLLPASALVIAAVLIWASTVAPAYRRETLGGDAWWTALYLGNWRFIETSSYFDQQAVPSPLLHMWSLGVEEQFYLVWPLAVAGVWAAVGRRNPRLARATLLVVTAAVAAVSAAMLLRYGRWHLYDRAYMGTDTKVFEPMAGALLAVAVAQDRGATWARRAAPPLGWVAVVALALLTPWLAGPKGASTLYYHGGALAFVGLCAVLVTTLALARVPLLSSALSWAAPVYLGRISYGIYLWHWPVTLILADEGSRSPVRTATILTSSTLLASISYHLVEKPLRARRLGPRWRPGRVLLAGLATTAGLALAASVVGGTPTSSAVNSVVTLPGSRGAEATLVLGDSVPHRLLPELSDAAERRGLTLFSATAGGCSPLGVVNKVSPSDKRGGPCQDDLPDRVGEALVAHRPGTVIWWSRYETADSIHQGRLLTPEQPEFWAAQQRQLQLRVSQLTQGGATLVFVATDRPGVGISSRCTPQTCNPFLRRMVEEDHYRARWNGILRATAAASTRVRVVDIDDVYCRDDATPCDDRNGTGVTVRSDGTHFSDPQMRVKVADAVIDRALASRRD